jgi:hypothetical protein
MADLIPAMVVSAWRIPRWAIFAVTRVPITTTPAVAARPVMIPAMVKPAEVDRVWAGMPKVIA